MRRLVHHAFASVRMPGKTKRMAEQQMSTADGEATSQLFRQRLRHQPCCLRADGHMLVSLARTGQSGSRPRCVLRRSKSNTWPQAESPPRQDKMPQHQITSRKLGHRTARARQRAIKPGPQPSTPVKQHREQEAAAGRWPRVGTQQGQNRRQGPRQAADRNTTGTKGETLSKSRTRSARRDTSSTPEQHRCGKTQRSRDTTGNTTGAPPRYHRDKTRTPQGPRTVGDKFRGRRIRTRLRAHSFAHMPHTTRTRNTTCRLGEQ